LNVAPFLATNWSAQFHLKSIILALSFAMLGQRGFLVLILGRDRRRLTTQLCVASNRGANGHVSARRYERYGI